MTTDRQSYWEDRLRKNAGLRGAGHISHSYSWNGWAYRVKKRVLRRLVTRAPLDVSNARVFDVGSGTGFAIEFWRDLGVGEITGSDITHFAVGNLQAEYPAARFFQLDIGGPAITVPGAPFTIVSAFEVLFHIVDDERFERALHNIYDLLEPGGHLIFSDNFLRYGELRTQHQASRTHGHIMAAIERAGFRCIRRAPMFVLMGYPVDSPSARRQQLWRRTVGRAARSERYGGAVGALLAPFEMMLTRLFTQGPTVELVVCRRPMG